MDLTDPSTIDASFTATAPRKWGAMGFQLLFMACVVALMLATLLGSRWGLSEGVQLALPGIFLLIVLSTGWRSGRRRRLCRDALASAWEHVQLEDLDAAERDLSRILRAPVATTSERGQAFMTLAAVCERRGKYAAVVHIYETMLIGRVGELSQLQEVQIKLAGAKVRNDELTDAVDLISRLAQVPMPPPLKAMFDLVRLFQRVFMGHFEDAIQDIDALRALFRRHLSTKAGQGYGLLAAAQHHLGRTAEAAKLWLDATTMIRPERLVREYPMLRGVSEVYPAAEPTP